MQYLNVNQITQIKKMGIETGRRSSFHSTEIDGTNGQMRIAPSNICHQLIAIIRTGQCSKGIQANKQTSITPSLILPRHHDPSPRVKAVVDEESQA